MGKTAFGSLGAKRKVEIDVPESGDMSIAPVGDDANIGLNILGKGTGYAAAAVVVERKIGVAGGSVDEHIWIAPRKMRVVESREIHSVAGGAAAVVMPRKSANVAPASGVALLTANFDLTLSANVMRSGTLTATDADKVFAAGDALSLDYGGTITPLDGVVIIVFVPEP